MKTDILTSQPSVKSSDAEWVQWHKDLKRNFGKKTANSIFLSFWEKRGSSSANTAYLRDYAGKQGFKIAAGAIAGIIDSTYDVFDSIGDIMQVAKIAGISLVGILVVGVGVLVFNLAKQPVEAIKAARG